MAQKLSVQIALEGGKEVERQLADIGEAGQKAFQQISQSAQEAGGFRNLKIGEVKAELQALGVTGRESINQITQAVRTAGRFEGLSAGVQQVEQSFDRAGAAAQRATAAFGLTRREINGVRTALRQIDLGPLGSQLAALGKIGAAFKGPGIAIAAIGAAIAAVTEATLGFAKTVSEISEKTKLDQVTQAFEKLKDAAARGFGAQGTQELKTLEAAAAGVGKAADLARQKLVELGLVQAPDIAAKYKEIADSIQGLSRADAARQVLQSLQEIRDPAERAAVAAKFFGDEAGPNLAQKLGQGASAASQYATAVSHLITQDDMNRADGLTQSIARLTETITRAGSLVFAPTLTQGIDAANEALGRLIARAQENPWGALAQGASLLNPINDIVQGIIIGVETLASKIAQTDIWASFSQAAVTSWSQITSAVQSAGQAIASFVSSLTGITWDAISSAGVAAWNAITSAINDAISALLKFIGLKPSAPATGAGATGKARGGLIGGVGSGTSDSNLAWLSRGEYVTPASVVRQPGVLGFLEAMRRRGGIPGYAEGGKVGEKVSVGGTFFGQIDGWIRKLEQALGGIGEAMTSLIDGTDRLINDLRQMLTTHSGNLRRAQDQIVDVMIALSDLSHKAASGQARGGLLGGRGTGTSDSNLAWVSRGEHIMPAAAVRQPGVLAFLEALRRSGGNLSAVLDGMGRFALGGLVPAPMGSVSHVTINFPGTPPISGLRASAGVVEQLQKAAALAQVRSGGRKPSRYS